MNITALKTFLAVVQTGNLNKAAVHLNVSQSTVTARLDSLDAVLGQRLLVRSRRGAELTKAGFAFQRHAELVVQSWDQARKAVGLPKGFSGLFSFVCPGELWDGAGSAWLDRVRDRHPDLALEAWPGDMNEVGRWLSSGLVDAALIAESLTGPGLASHRVTPDRLVQVSTVCRTVQSWDPDYIYVDLGAEFRRQHSRAWPIDETAHMTFGSSRWALDHLLEHGGSAYLPWRLSATHVRQGRLHPVEGAPEFTRALFLAWREASLTTHPWLRDAIEWI
ncbi:MAG: LysR family transcriptional regulator [Alphaproteobacteria bacterium]|nr:LysR family transcriptional regulator [Alphaproteobacteria bacterium]